MKKTKKIIILFCFAVFVFNLFSVNLMALDLIDSKNEMQDATNSVNRLISVLDENRVVNTSYPLYGSNNDIVGYCFLLSPIGYVITSTNSAVVEASFEDCKSYQMLKELSNDMVYYAGPMSYYRKTNNEYVNVLTQNIMAVDSFEQSVNAYIAKTSVDAKESLSTTSTVQPASVILRYDIEGTLRSSISYNPTGICGATAAAILLMYYYDYKNQNIVPDEYVSTDAVSLIQYLVPSIHGDISNPTGAILEDVRDGLDLYFLDMEISTVNLGSNIGYETVTNLTYLENSLNHTYLDMKAEITSDRPIIVMLNGAPTYGNHFVVAHSVMQDASGGTYYIYANDGWGSNNVLINIEYAVGYVCLNK